MRPVPAPDVATDRDLAAVQVLRWPAESGRRDPGRPCLWLLAVGELAPLDQPGDDWVRAPFDERDLRARVERLAARATAPTTLLPGEVEIDLDGRVERCGAIVHLPPIEAHLLTELAAQPERVVTRRALSMAVWGADGPGGRALDSRIHALRRGSLAHGPYQLVSRVLLQGRHAPPTIDRTVRFWPDAENSNVSRD